MGKKGCSSSRPLATSADALRALLALSLVHPSNFSLMPNSSAALRMRCAAASPVWGGAKRGKSRRVD